MGTLRAMSDREYSLYRELLKDLQDLDNISSREHWYYRSAMFLIRTNLWDKYKYLMERAREYREEHEI